jgi:hypothetical protein
MLAGYCLEVGPALVTDAAMVRQVMVAMHLPTLQTDVRLAPNVRALGFLMPVLAAQTEVQRAPHVLQGSPAPSAGAGGRSGGVMAPAWSPTIEVPRRGHTGTRQGCLVEKGDYRLA